MPTTTSPIDLTTVAQVKTYIFGGTVPNSSVDDPLIQKLITAWSRTFINRVSRDLDNTQATIFNGIQTFTDRLSGNGKDELLLSYFPIITVNSLTICGRAIAQTPDYIQQGWAIGEDQDSLILINDCFDRGRYNVALTWQAGYSVTPDDVVDAANQMVAIKYKRRSTLDQGSIALPEGGGQTTYRSWECPPEVERVMGAYMRRFA